MFPHNYTLNQVGFNVNKEQIIDKDNRKSKIHF